MAQKLTKSNIDTELVYKALLYFLILKDIAFKVTKKLHLK